MANVSAVFHEFPPQCELEQNSFEYVVVIEDASPGGGSELTTDLKVISEQLQDDLMTNKELDNLESGFLRLSQLLAEQKPDQPYSGYRHKIASQEASLDLNCCSICLTLFTDLDEFHKHTTDHLHLNAMLQTMVLYACKVCSEPAFGELDLILDHVTKIHHVIENLDFLIEKVNVLQMYSPDPAVVLERIRTLGNGVLLPPDSFCTRRKRGSPKMSDLKIESTIVSPSLDEPPKNDIKISTPPIFEPFHFQTKLTEARANIEERIKTPKCDSIVNTDLNGGEQFAKDGIHPSGQNRRKFLVKRRKENPNCTSKSLIRRRSGLIKPGEVAGSAGFVKLSSILLKNSSTGQKVATFSVTPLSNGNSYLTQH